jgi:DNA polymerase-3 subunit delta
MPKGLQMISVFIGDNTSERDKAFLSYIKQFIAVNGDLAVDRLNADELNTTKFIDAVTTLPFLSPKRLVIIKYLSSNKEVAEKFNQIAKRIADSTEVVILETSLDNRSIYAKTLKKIADSYNNFTSLEGDELVKWLINEVATKNGSLTKKDAIYLIDRLGHNQQIINSEIDKLLLYDQNISKQTIDLMTKNTPSSSVFNMLDALMQGSLDKASKIYDEQRQQGSEPQAIMGMINWQLNILANIIAGHGDSPDVIAKRAKISPYVVKKNFSVITKLNKTKIVQLLDLAIITDFKIKTGKLKPDQGVHSLLIQIASVI